MNTLKTSVVEVSIEEGLIVGVVKENSFISEYEVNEVLDWIAKTCESRNFVFLADIRCHHTITKGARRAVADWGSKKPQILGNALLVESYISLVMANLFIFFSKPEFPTRVFTSLEEALSWSKDINRKPRHFVGGFFDDKLPPIIEEIQNVLIRFSRKDFTARVASQPESIFNGLALSVNLIGEELGDYVKRLDKESHDKIDFIAKISHELRTPLTVIIGFTDLLLMGGGNTEIQEKYLRTIKNNSSLLLKMISDILILDKMNHSKESLNISNVDLADLLSQIFNVFSREAERKGLLFEIEKSIDLPASIFTDRKKLLCILHNLVENAVKFTDFGSVSLKVSLEHSFTSRASIIFAVEDTGIGVDPEIIEYIMEPFFQVRSGTAGPIKGIGAGLSVSKKYAELLGGSLIIAESSLGQGSIFLLSLKIKGPVSENHAMPYGSPSDTPSP